MMDFILATSMACFVGVVGACIICTVGEYLDKRKVLQAKAYAEKNRPRRKLLRFPTKYYCGRHTLYLRKQEFAIVVSSAECAGCKGKNKLTLVVNKDKV